MSVTRTLRRVVPIAGPIAGLAAGLSGCVLAAPSAFQVATYAADGASYVATGKSVTDHLISTATAKDCAMGRLLDGEDICREMPEGPYDRMPDGTLAPNAKDAAMQVQPAENDEDFQTFAAHANQGPFDDADVLPAEDPTTTVVRWAEPPAPSANAQPMVPRAAPVTAVETAALDPAEPPMHGAGPQADTLKPPPPRVGAPQAETLKPPPPREAAPQPMETPPMETAQANATQANSMQAGETDGGFVADDEDLSALLDPNAGGDTMVIGDDADELLTPADVQALLNARASPSGQ